MDVVEEGHIDSFGHVELLEEIIVLLFLGVEVVD